MDSDTTFKVKRSTCRGGAYCGGLPHSLLSSTVKASIDFDDYIYIIITCSKVYTAIGCSGLILYRYVMHLAEQPKIAKTGVQLMKREENMGTHTHCMQF